MQWHSVANLNLGVDPEAGRIPVNMGATTVGFDLSHHTVHVYKYHTNSRSRFSLVPLPARAPPAALRCPSGSALYTLSSTRHESCLCVERSHIIIKYTALYRASSFSHSSALESILCFTGQLRLRCGSRLAWVWMFGGLDFGVAVENLSLKYTAYLYVDSSV